MRVRKGHHHISIPIALLFTFLAVYLGYRVLVTSNFWNDLTAGGTKLTDFPSGCYEIEMYEDGRKVVDFPVTGEVQVQKDWLIVREKDRTLYYPIKSGVSVVVTRLKENGNAGGGT
jgi:hypothetical protein